VANCAIHLSVANPSPGDQEIPRSLVMSGTALDGTATSGSGISRVEAFLGNRDAGGTFVGMAGTPAAGLGAWSLTATFPPNMSGGQNLFVYGMSSVSGQEAIVSIPIVVGEALEPMLVSDIAQSVCPAVMPSPTAIPTVAATPALAAPAPTAAPTAQPVAPAPTVAPTTAPVATAAPVAAPAPVQLSIMSPAAPPLTFDTTTLSAPAGAQVTVTFTNNEVGIPHNWHVFNGPDSSAPTLAATQIITGPGTVDSVTFTAPTQVGSNFFWCDVHPTVMTGSFDVNGSQ
jgi:plastocyanin